MATKFGTLFRSKDQEEVRELESEGVKAISVQADEPVKFDSDEDVMCVGEERVVLRPGALDDPAVKELIMTLLSWINDTLEEKRIVVRDIVEDMYDGQVLGELLQVLMGQSINVISVTQSSYMQRNKLKHLLEKVNKVLGINENQQKWSVQGIHTKNVVQILHLLVALARRFRCNKPLPRNVFVKQIHLLQKENKIESNLFEEEITGEDIGPTAPAPAEERDVFDKLFEEAPEKLDAVMRSLCQFSTKVLQEMDIVISNIENQFDNGVCFIFMMGLLEGYFVPLFQYHYSPTGFDEKVDNMKLVFRLLDNAGLPKPRAKPEDLVHKDLKSTLRVLYAIFGKYKSAVQQASKPPPATSV